MNILISYMYRYWKIIALHVVLLMTILFFFGYSTSIVYGDSLTSLGDSSTSGVMIPDGGSVSNDIKSNVNNDLLGVAANFHIFANKATLNAHTNGNLAVDELAGNVNFGTNIHEGTVSKDIYYIGELDSINASSFVSDQGNRTNKVVFGSGVPVYVKSGQVYVKGDERLDHLNSADVYQDTTGSKYIDIKGVLNDLSKNSSNLYTKNSDTRLISFVGQDPNSRNIDVSGLKANDNNQTIIDIKASDLEENTPISIKGIAKNSGSIILNVVNNNDDPITGTVNVNSKIQLIYTDGTTRSNHETEDFSDAHILWNFGQSTEVNVNDPFQGSVLAPKADISVGQNLDGNIIGNSVTINAESHRWDFQQGDTPTPSKPSAPVTPSKPSAPVTPSKPSAHRMNKVDRDTQLHKENKLPQTNEKRNKFLLFIGLVMASLTGASVIRVIKSTLC